MPYAEFTLWLTPHKALAGRLRSLIRRLAEEFDAIPLEPHLTVFCGPSDEAEAARMHIKPPPDSSRSSFWLRICSIQTCIPKHCCAVYRVGAVAPPVRVRGRELHSNLDLSAQPPPQSDLQTMVERKQQELCRRLTVPMGAYLFDAVQVVETEQPIMTPDR